MNIRAIAPVASVVLDIQRLGGILVRRVEVPRLLEVRQEAIPTPARLTFLFLSKVGGPAVIVVLVSPMHLKAVDAGAAAEHDAADDGGGTVIEAGLRGGGEGEEVALVGKGSRAAGNGPDGRAIVYVTKLTGYFVNRACGGLALERCKAVPSFIFPAYLP